MNPVVDSTKLERAKVWGQSDSSVRWQGAFARYGGNGTTASSKIVYEIEPGGRLGWHTDATEETQYIIAGTGKLHLEDGTTCAVGPGSVFVLPTPLRHDLENTGKDTLRAVAFFAAAMFTQTFDQVMMPPKTHILGTPNREGQTAH
jgi:quercetin dioxygenase-like cupin family protein